MATLTDTLKIDPNDYPASLEMDSFSASGVKGEVKGYKGSNVRLVWSGEAKVHNEGTKGFRSDIALWVGPLTIVPHLVVSYENIGECVGVDV